MMKRVFIFSFIVLGISSIIGQVVIIRELMVSFYGNEFFIGWVLFAWLFWVGIGSLLLEKIFTPTTKNFGVGVVSCHILVALFLPLEIYLVRLSKTIIGGTPGEIPNLIPALLYAFLITAPLCLILGFQFVIANKFWHSSLNVGRSASHILGKSYFCETIGFIIGGLIFSYILIFINEFTVSGILAWCNLIAAGLLLFLIKNELITLKIIAVVLLIVFAGIFVWAKNINIETSKLRFPHQEFIESKNSLYGNIVVTKTDSQYNFYESGLLLGADREEIFNEHLVHFPLLYHSNPKNILLIGAGFNGALGEILKHQPENVYYLELDPQLIEIINRYIDLQKVNIITQDARYFLKNTLEKFDVIIINLPNPSTALINRFYSQEFLEEIQTHLNPQGILSFHLSSSPNYLNPELENLQASLYKTIKEVFPYLIILPEDTNFFIASLDNILDYNPRSLIQKLKQRNIKNNFVTENYIEYRLTNDRTQNALDSLKNNKQAKINQDQRPVSYYYNFVYWISYFHSGLAKFLSFLSKINFWWAAMFLVLGIALFRVKKNLFPVTMAVAGFSLMATEIIIIYSFQVFYGYLYYKIGLIITTLMVGMAIGTWLGIKKLAKAKISYLFIIHGLIIVFCLTFLLESKLFLLLYLPLAAFIGGIIGFEFPVINKLYLQKKNNTRKNLGVIYGADLLGSCLGALLVSVFAIPIFGIFQTLILIIAFNVLILFYLFHSNGFGF